MGHGAAEALPGCAGHGARQVREPVAGHVFYYFKPTGDSQWDPPKEFEEKFCCTWRNCQRQFNSLLGSKRPAPTGGATRASPLIDGA